MYAYTYKQHRKKLNINHAIQRASAPAASPFTPNDLQHLAAQIIGVEPTIRGAGCWIQYSTSRSPRYTPTTWSTCD